MQFGITSELADLFAGGVMALGAKTLTDGFDQCQPEFTETYDTALDLYKTMGLTSGAMELLIVFKRGMFSLTVSEQEAA